MTDDDYPKSLGKTNVKAARLEMLSQEHILPLTDFVNQIRAEKGLTDEVPYFDPLDGGINARCLFVLEAPGGKTLQSCFLSRNNPDETARNFFQLNQEAGLPRKETISWNIVPWYIGSGTRIRGATRKDVQEGLPYLDRLIELLPDLRVIVLVGKKAQVIRSYTGGNWLRYHILDCPHPSPRNLNSRPEYRTKMLEVLTEVRTVLSLEELPDTKENHGQRTLHSFQTNE